MSISPLLTPRSSPGSVPTSDTTQKCPIDVLTKLAAFISGAPGALLSAVKSAATEDELREILARIDASDPRLQPTLAVTDICKRIHEWLRLHGRRGSASKDVIPLSMLLLLKHRIRNRGTCALLKYDDSVKITVAVKVAYGNTCDCWMTLDTWKKQFDIPKQVVQKAEVIFLESLDWETWVREEEFSDFVQRMELLWDIVLKGGVSQKI